MSILTEFTMDEASMKFVSYIFTSILSILIMVGFTLPSFSQAEKQDDLIGHLKTVKN